MNELTQIFEESFQYATRCAAIQLRINEALFSTVEELYPKIKEHSEDIYEALMSFKTKSDSWVEFHNKVAKSGSSGALISAEQSDEQVKVHLELTEARNAFIKSLQRIA